MVNNVGLSGDTAQISGKNGVSIKSDGDLTVQTQNIQFKGTPFCDKTVSSKNQLANKSYVDSNVPLFNTISLDYKNESLSSDCGYVLLSSGSGNWISGTSFPKVYEHLTGDLNSSSPSNDTYTVLSNDDTVQLSVQYQKSDDGHKILPAELGSDKIEKIVNATGRFWYYTVISSEGKFKLPSVSSDGYVYMRCI